MALCLTGCEAIQGKEDKKVGADARMVEAQTQAQIQNAQLQIEANKRITTLQLEVIKQCVSDKHIPVFINGNVDCKK